MSRESVEAVVSKMYKHHVKTKGLPSGKEVRAMEKRVQRIAQQSDNKKRRKR